MPKNWNTDIIFYLYINSLSHFSQWNVPIHSNLSLFCHGTVAVCSYSIASALWWVAVPNCHFCISYCIVLLSKVNVFLPWGALHWVVAENDQYGSTENDQYVSAEKLHCNEVWTNLKILALWVWLTISVDDTSSWTVKYVMRSMGISQESAM